MCGRAIPEDLILENALQMSQLTAKLSRVQPSKYTSVASSQGIIVQWGQRSSVLRR